MSVTVVTIVRDRTAHLLNVIEGLERGTRRPDRYVVVRMGGAQLRDVLPATSFATDVIDLPEPDASLPLAPARNAGARAAEPGPLVFLDVDCIPGRELVARYERALRTHDVLAMGGVRYLAAGAVGDGWDEHALHERSRPHPARPEPTGQDLLVATDRYDLFWSLSFGVRRTTFLDRIGGFDERMTGYGAEDTDLAFRARAAGVPLRWLTGATAYHQHHDSYDPPVQHVASIVANARRFREAWGRWPMEGWLGAFAELGLVDWDPDGARLELLREPTAEERRAARRDHVVAPAIRS